MMLVIAKFYLNLILVMFKPLHFKLKFYSFFTKGQAIIVILTY